MRHERKRDDMQICRIISPVSQYKIKYTTVSDKKKVFYKCGLNQKKSICSLNIDEKSVFEGKFSHCYTEVDLLFEVCSVN